MIDRELDRKMREGEHLTTPELMKLIAGYMQLHIALEGCPREYALVQNDVYRRRFELEGYLKARKENAYREQNENFTYS